MKKWSRINYQPNLPLWENRRATCSDEHIGLSQYAAQEGIVLLKTPTSYFLYRWVARFACLEREPLIM